MNWMERKILANRKLALAKAIKNCFKEVDWTSQQFMVSGTIMKAGSEDKFYKKSDIDKAIKKLNRIQGMLSKGNMKCH